MPTEAGRSPAARVSGSCDLPTMGGGNSGPPEE